MKKTKVGKVQDEEVLRATVNWYRRQPACRDDIQAEG